MLRTLNSARRTSGKNMISAFAMAIALAGGAIVATSASSTQVMAQDYSDGFAEIYQPVADVVNAEDGDLATVSGQFSSIVAAASTPDDKFAVGNLLLIAGNNDNNPTWQRQGLELQIESGKLPPENLGQFNWYIGNLAYQADDFMDARTALLAATAAGWTQDDPTGLIAETYYQMDDISGGVNYVIGAAQQRKAAGGEIPEQWLLRGLQGAYSEDLLQEAVALSILLVEENTTQENWTNGLQVINGIADFDEQSQLDMLRLMRLTNSMTDVNEFTAYIESADPRIMSNEVSDVLAAGLAAGQFYADDNYYVEVKSIVDERMASDRADAPSLVAEAETEAGGQGAMLAGDLLYSLDDFAGAETMYAMALNKGGVDVNTVRTRLGIAQTRLGSFSAAIATFEQVAGQREPIARMWAAYASIQGG